MQSWHLLKIGYIQKAKVTTALALIYFILKYGQAVICNVF